MTRSITTSLAIGDQTVLLDVTYSFVKGAPATVNDIDGGDPGYGPEIDVQSISWAARPDKAGKQEWHQLERGPLFDLIAADEGLRADIIDHEETAQPEEV